MTVRMSHMYYELVSILYVHPVSLSKIDNDGGNRSVAERLHDVQSRATQK